MRDTDFCPSEYILRHNSVARALRPYPLTPLTMGAGAVLLFKLSSKLFVLKINNFLTICGTKYVRMATMENNRFIFIDGYIDDKPPGGGPSRGSCGVLILLVCALLFSAALLVRYVALRPIKPEADVTETPIAGIGADEDSAAPDAGTHSYNNTNAYMGFKLAEPGTTELDYPDIYTAVLPSTLAVYASTRGGVFSAATAIVISRDGAAITCYHVLEGADHIELVTASGTVVPAEIKAYDELSDVALMVYDSARASGAKPAVFGYAPDVGNRLLLLGNPIDGTLTLTDGLLSASRANANVNGYPTGVIMTSAAVTDGHSGAPLINLYGQVIGMANSRLRISGNSETNISFAISAETLKPIVDDLLTYGRVPGRASLGAELVDIQSGFAAFMGMPGGALVRSVSAQKAAYQDGGFLLELVQNHPDALNVGDIITAVNGTETINASAVLAQINKYSVGDTVQLSVWRNNAEIQIEVTLIEQ